MRNKGFFWFLTILLTAICVYQLSFTFISNSEEAKANKAADTKVEELKESSKSTGMVGTLPNGTELDFNDSESEELAKAAYVNQILRDKAETPVYPVFGSTFKEVKKRSLAFGLDLVGGMSVTMEISIPDLVKNYARNERSQSFTKIYDAAIVDYNANGGSFIDIFVAKHNALSSDSKFVKLFDVVNNDELTTQSSTQDVVDFLKVKEAASMDGVADIMERRINQFGVAQPNIQKDPANNRLYIELPGVQDEATVEEKLSSTANLQFFENYKFSEIGQFWEQANILSQTDLNEVVVEEDSVATESEDSLDLSLDALDDLSDLNLDEEKTGLMSYLSPFSDYYFSCSSEDKLKVDKLLAREDIKSVFSDDVRFMWSADLQVINNETNESAYLLYVIKVPSNGRPRVGGTDVTYASTGFDQEDAKITVDLTMSADGSDKWAQMTADNTDRIVSITMDNLVFSAPYVNGPISGGNTQISGSFSINEAQDLSGLLNGGSLPAPCLIKEQTRVGPTIGAENSRAGLISFACALFLVFVYMVFYYGKAGIIADVALFANILFIFGSLASFGAVLTLAGIAGIVLTIGMAVDANVLIFERIREEQANGKDVKSAIDTGFKKALSSIIDANVTTLLTAVVLKSFGTGPIESFATTLIIGIFTSVFAALVITRLLMLWWMKSGKGINFETKLTKGAFKGLNFNFVGKRKLYYMISGVLMAGALLALFGKGLNPSVEFSGGRSFGVKFENTTTGHKELVADVLKKEFTDANGKEASVEIKTKTNSFFLEITTNYLLSNEKNSNEQVKAALKSGLDKCKPQLGDYSIQESRSVTTKVSDELVSSSMLAIILSLIIIFAYILIRFGRWQYSTGAIIAMVHDVLVVLGVFAIFNGILPFNMDIDQAFVAAILTVIGYSINDTVVVFDRIREDLTLHKNVNEEEQINKSLNSTLSRTINTSMTTFIVLLIVFLFGGAAIKGFIFALMIGVIVGTYSSLCIATPILIDFSKNKLKEDQDKAILRAEEVAAAKAERDSMVG